MSSPHAGRNTSNVGALAGFVTERAVAPPLRLELANPLDQFTSERELAGAAVPQSILDRDSKSYPTVVRGAIVTGASGPVLRRHRSLSPLATTWLAAATGLAICLGGYWAFSKSPESASPSQIVAASTPTPEPAAPPAYDPAISSLPEAQPGAALLENGASDSSRGPKAAAEKTTTKSPARPPAVRKVAASPVRDKAKPAQASLRQPAGSPGRAAPRNTPVDRPPPASSAISSDPRALLNRPVASTGVTAAPPTPDGRVREGIELPAMNSVPAPALPSPPPPDFARRVEGSAASGKSAAAPVTRPAARDEDEVRSILSRYRSAYDRLDATAAKDIWPSVNERALARAFEGLESQEVEFSNCRLAVSGNNAQASCAGTASYVRKVGSKVSQREPRQWTFKLKKQSNAWQIDSVQTR